MERSKEDFSFTPIGQLYSAARQRFEAPRQAAFAGVPAYIEIDPAFQPADSLADLDGFERVWIVFLFHLNCTWRPKVSPPFTPENRKYGLFATRSPHRPNRIGLSCVKLLSVSGNRLNLGPCDILDNTPVLDIKPYIPEADAFPESKAGWRDRLRLSEWHIEFVPAVLPEVEFLRDQAALDTRNFCEVQLKYNPFDSKKKRIDILPNGMHRLHYRTWNLDYSADEQNHLLVIQKITGNYSDADLLPGTPDPHQDKNVHRLFRELFQTKEIHS